MRFFILLFICILQLGRVQSAHANQSDFWDHHFYPVVKRITDQTSGLTFLTGALSTVTAHTQDEPTRENWKNYQKIDKNTAHIGDLLGTGGASALAIGTQYFFDDVDKHYQSHLRGFVYGAFSIYLLKSIGNRQRPGDSRNYQSFPSGHTAIMFMSATSLAYAYGWKAAVIAYPLAAFTGATRLAADVHWFSDTVAGAFLGFLVGRATYYDQNEDSSSQLTYQMYPVVTYNQMGLAFQKNF